MGRTYTSAERERIARDFAQRHGGTFDVKRFVAEVEAVGPSHPAFEWFEWDDERAAAGFRLIQARKFIQGIKIKFRVVEPEHKPVRIRVGPGVISPVGGRQNGGGYVFAPHGPTRRRAFLREVASEAALTLEQWMRRYDAALAAADVDVECLREAIAALRRFSASKDPPPNGGASPRLPAE